MNICHIGTLWYLCVIIVCSRGQGLGKPPPSSYYYLKQNGGYEYAFNTDTGLQSSQTADQANEVTGHYMYYDKGVPFMVKYRAGIHGFQPEIIPAEKLLGGNFDERSVPSYNTQNNVLTSRDIRPSALAEPVQNNYRLTQTQQLASSPTVSSFSIGSTDTTLKFVQDALKTMQTQPMHLSFSDLGQIQHPAGPFMTTTMQPPPATLLQPVTRNDVQDINNLAASPTQPLEPPHPYSFKYNADQSSRSESADQSGNVIGRYTYYDEAGYHDVSYKAGDDTGFVILGSNSQNSAQAPLSLPPPTVLPQQQQPQPNRQFFRANNLDTFNLNNYRMFSDARLASNSLDERNFGKRSTRSNSPSEQPRYQGTRSLRKFRRYSKW